MKKITAFFMALFPFLVIGVLFATGLISKDFTDKTVQRLEMKQDIVKVQKTTNDKLVHDISGNVRVLPDIVRDPTVFWTTDDTSLATVEKETGKVTINELGYGDIKLHAVAKTNAAAKADCTLKVWDNKIHHIDVTNATQAEFVSPGSQLLLETKTIPSENIENPKLEFSVKETTSSDIQVNKDTGLVTIGANADDSASATIHVESVANPSASTDVKIKVQSSVDAIGFKNDGDTLIKETSYNLYDEVITAPYRSKEGQKLDPEKYFTFESSDPENAPIDTKGNITFKNGYTPFSYVTFTVKFAGLDDISCSKRIASSFEYYSNVSFDQGYTKTLILDSNETQEIKYSTYPVDGDTSKIVLQTSDPQVVEVTNDKKFIVKGAGKATLTINAKMTEQSVISDTIEVNVLNNDEDIFNRKEISLQNTNYYPLRQNLTKKFAYVNNTSETIKDGLTWSIQTTEGVTLQDDILYFLEPTSVTVEVEYTNGSISLTDTATITCNSYTPEVVKVDADYPTIEAGKVFTLEENSATVALQSVPSTILDLGNKKYMAKCGCGETPFSLKTENGTSFSLIASEKLLGLKTDADWSNYTTNASTVKVASKVELYPSTATNIESSITETHPVVPAVEYEFTPVDPSAVDIKEDNSLVFNKPTTVAIKATCEELSYDFSVTSYCGRNGKFSLQKFESDETIKTGATIQLDPNGVIKFKIDKFYLSDIGTPKTELANFSITALSGNEKIVKVEKKCTNDYIYFEITGVSSGKDTIEISNKSYTQYIYVEVSSKITSLELYSLGNLLPKYTEETKKEIKVYPTDDKLDGLIINMDFSPVAARDDKLTIKFNNNVIYSEFNPGLLNLSEGSGTTSKIAWDKTNANTLEIIRNSDQVVLGKYVFRYTTEAPKFSIYDSHEVSSKNMFYLTAKQQNAVMEIVLDEPALCNQEYYSKTFKVTEGSTLVGNIVGKYIILASPEAGSSKEITINNTNTNTYVLKRDKVSKIELPKHDNLDESDAKGLQRVHVYGTQSQYPNEARSDIYKLPITIYDEKDQEIKGESKTTAINNLTVELSGITKAQYSSTKDCFEITFAKDTAHVYDIYEIFNNKFTDLIKNQTFTIGTEYGQYHPLDKSCFAWYSFVVVTGVNVWDEKAFIDTLNLKNINDRNVVMQINFGMEGEKETTPFTYEGSFIMNTLYGNGYALNFDAHTKKPFAANVYAKHLSNLRSIGCNDDTFKTLKEKKTNWKFAKEGNDEQHPYTVSYCTFTKFYQTITTGVDEGSIYTHIKNCMFFNEAENCVVTISADKNANVLNNVITVEDCVFFNSSKICMLISTGSTIRFKGSIEVYNFHSSDMFDALDRGPEFSEWAWNKLLPILESADLVQGSEYGSEDKKVMNAYLMTLLNSHVQFYDHTDKSGQDVFVEAQHGTEKAANYLKYGTGLELFGQHIVDVWSTVKPPLPLQFGHSPAYTDEFVKDSTGIHLNTDVRNLLLQMITRW